MMAEEGHQLFKSFQVLNLTCQHRAKDPLHASGVRAFREWNAAAAAERASFLGSLRLII
jgi:hypothetical protein